MRPNGSARRPRGKHLSAVLKARGKHPDSADLLHLVR